MKERLLFAFAIVLIATVAIRAQMAEERARISQMIGSVEVRSGATVAWRKARIGMALGTNWDIRCYLESSAEITFESGTIVKIGENSVITISKLIKDNVTNASQSTIKVMSGQVWANVKKLTNTNSEFDFETPTAVASIRGTRLGIETGGQKTRIDVYEGLVLVRKRDGKQAVPVTSQNRAIVESGSEEIKIVAFKSLLQQETLQEEQQPVDPFSPATIDSLIGNQDSTTLPDTGVSGNYVVDSAGQTIISEPYQVDSISGNSSEEADGNLSLLIMSPAAGSIIKESPVMIRAKSAPGASISINNKSGEITHDGNFAEMIDLKPGTNMLQLKATLKNYTASATLNLEYRPELGLHIANLENNMEVSSRTIQLDITVTDGARYAVNGKEGENRVELKEGKNLLTVDAWNAWGTRVSQQFHLSYHPVSGFVLNLLSPAHGAVTKSPFIQVTGTTVQGAKIFVNDMQIPSGQDGFFSYRVPIPDEPQEYSVEIRAEYKGKELVEERNIVYEPAVDKLLLDIGSPVHGQVINRRTVRLNGKTTPRAVVTVNGLPVNVTSTGLLSSDISFSERDIGFHTLEINARLQDKEITKTIDLHVSAGSPQINTSAPHCIAQVSAMQATNRDRYPVQVFDRTPEDQLTLSITNNGRTEEFVTDPGRSEFLMLNEGLNTYTIKATDKAGNVSNVINGKVYYLPGPLSLTVNEPSANPCIIEGLPPLPRQYGVLKHKVEIEIDDGIGRVPETIRYCKLIGNGQTLLLRNNNDYRYRGEVQLSRGRNTFTIQVEDLAGNSVLGKLDIVIK